MSGKVSELRCIVGEQTVCLGGLRCGLMPAIGGGLPQSRVSRISGGRAEPRMERVQAPALGKEVGGSTPGGPAVGPDRGAG